MRDSEYAVVKCLLVSDQISADSDVESMFLKITESATDDMVARSYRYELFTDDRRSSARTEVVEINIVAAALENSTLEYLPAIN